MTKEELSKKIIEVAYLEGDFVLSSGRKSKYYLDKFLFETNPEILPHLVKEMVKLLPPLSDFDLLAGPELGAVPLATALSLETKIPFVIVRKAEKGYGTSKAMEGKLKKGDRVVLIEDILTSGSQAVKAAERLKEADAEVILILGVIDRQEGARETIEKAGYTLKSVFTKSELGV